MTPGTYTQLYIHLIFAVKNREAKLTDDIRKTVFEYMSGIITAMDHKSIIVGGVSDHTHILLGFNPLVTVSDTVYHIKRSTSLFINKQRFCPDNFSWQKGYGAFSYSRSKLSRVFQYILNQEKHHQKTTFKTEYLEFLEKFSIEYDEKYLFDFWDNK